MSKFNKSVEEISELMGMKKFDVAMVMLELFSRGLLNWEKL